MIALYAGQIRQRKPKSDDPIAQVVQLLPGPHPPVKAPKSACGADAPRLGASQALPAAAPASTSPGRWRPRTPETADLAPPAPPPLGHDTTAALQSAFVVFSKNLVRLNRRVLVSPTMHAAALALLEEAARGAPALANAIRASPKALLAAAAAALWIAIKFLGVRPASPNGGLMSQATQVGLRALVAQELTLLEALGWEVGGVVRRRGISAP